MDNGELLLLRCYHLLCMSAKDRIPISDFKISLTESRRHGGREGKRGGVRSGHMTFCKSPTSNTIASPAMIVDGGVGPAENHLLDEIVGQKIMREAEFDFGGVVQLGQLFIC